MTCDDCGLEYPQPEPRLYSFNSPLGACPECEGFGNVIDIDMDLVVPDPSKTLREGAIAPWNTPAYAHELEELLALAPAIDLPLDVPFRELSEEQRNLDSRRRAGAQVRRAGRLLRLAGAAEIQDAHPRVPQPLAQLSPCPACGGSRLRPEALATRIGGLNIAEISAPEDSRCRSPSSASLPLHRLGAERRPDDARTGAGAAGLSRSRRAWAISRSTARCARSAAANRSAWRSPRPSARAWSTCSTCSTSRRSACIRPTSTG